MTARRPLTVAEADAVGAAALADVVRAAAAASARDPRCGECGRSVYSLQCDCDEEMDDG